MSEPDEEVAPDETLAPDGELGETRASGSDRPSAPPPPEELAPGMAVTERVRLVRPLGHGGMASVWAAEHLTLGIDVAVKFVRATYDSTMRRRLSREAKLAAKIDHPHAVRIFDHGLTPDGTPFLVMELLTGESLADRLKRDGPMSLANVERLVSQIADVLAEAHSLGIVHRDIKPDNVMLIAGTDDLFAKVVDFGIAKPIEAPDGATLTTEGHVVGTPAYMAPEQLLEGRPANQASDLWGLGVLTYESLAGRRPFDGRMRAAIGAAMLLRRFQPICSLRPELPASLNAWFDRALTMERGERFESARELSATFAAAAHGTEGAVAREQDHGGHLRIPERLYGRDTEIAALMRAFEAAAMGGSRVALVAGYAGIGKTALVREVHPKLTRRGATFVVGKLDPYDRGTPYASLVQAFRGLVRAVLDDEGPDRAAKEARLIDAAAEHGPVLADVIPELAALLGPQPPLVEVSPSEARHRFHHAISRFVRGLASSANPLVVFLDDLQWSDLPTLELLTSLSTEPDSRHVLLIGAYRRNEVDAAHPLTSSLEHMRAVGAALDEIALGPLEEDAVLDLITDTFGSAPGRLRLAVLCHGRTRGNAFFLRRTLESLYEDGTLCYDREARQWSFDLPSLQQRAMAENLVDFVADEIRRLPARQREALQVAACIGDRFDLDLLASALGEDRGTVLDRLRPALATELVQPVTESSWLTATIDQVGTRISFRFTHDRIRQAARSLLDAAEAARIHQHVGRFLLQTLGYADRERRLFEIVEHLNRGTDAAAEPDAADIARLRALNLEASRRASRSAAFEAADGFLQEALGRLGADPWSADYRETLAIHVEGARAASLVGDLERMESLVRAAVAEARDVVDRVGAQEVRIHASFAQQQFHEAVRRALAALAELGVELPPEPGPADVEAAVSATLDALRAHDQDAIVALPSASDPRLIAAMRIQSVAMSAAYLAEPNLLPLLTCNIVRSTLSHGVCKESPYGFAVYALVLTAIGLIDVGYATGKIAIALLDRVGDRSVWPRTMHVVVGHVNPFVDPVRQTIEQDREVFRLGMDTGDLEFAGWGLHMMVAMAMYGGVQLDELSRMAMRNTSVLEHKKLLPALGCTLPYRQAIENLSGAAPDPTRLVGPSYDEVEHAESMRAVGFRGGLYILAAVGTFVRYLFRDLEGAVAFADEGAEYADGAVATYHPVWWHQYRALAVLGCADPADPESVAAALASVAPNLTQLRAWLPFSEGNHAHRVAMVEAEMARIDGRSGDAMELYERAIAAAAENLFAHEEALANELAGRFHAQRGSVTPARAYLAEACARYERWGAGAKVAQLREEHAALFA